MDTQYRRRPIVSREVVIKKLTKVLGKLAQTLPVDSAYLYGSYANGKPKIFSDVDVVVVSPKFGNDIVKETTWLMELFEETGLMVEPRAYSRQEFERAEPGTFLYDEVLEKGIRLV
ncbi:MAG: uncharacterized protein PWQ96_152 [Clostridia bacterium]|nr:uncharacterized protein [Clostridia bacterium]